MRQKIARDKPDEMQQKAFKECYQHVSNVLWQSDSSKVYELPSHHTGMLNVTTMLCRSAEQLFIATDEKCA
eukprot:scaffold53066_cov21-Prasinocladus_malaysianus.AAC.2